MESKKDGGGEFSRYARLQYKYIEYCARGNCGGKIHFIMYVNGAAHMHFIPKWFLF
jgi:hypothetical protein